MTNMRAFVADAQPFDDITMLAFRWFGPADLPLCPSGTG